VSLHPFRYSFTQVIGHPESGASVENNPHEGRSIATQIFRSPGNPGYPGIVGTCTLNEAADFKCCISQPDNEPEAIRLDIYEGTLQ